jgi:hypothetical protein
METLYRFVSCFIFLTLPLQAGIIACGYMILKEKIQKAIEKRH